MIEIPNRKKQSDSDFALEFYEQYKGLMYRLALRLTGNRQNCEDLVQETLRLLLEKIDIIRKLEPAQREAYIVRTMRNYRINEIKRSKIIQMIPTEDEKMQRLLDDHVLCYGNPYDILPRLEVVMLMEKLSVEDRLLLDGWYLQGLSAEELADKLGCKPDSIRTKLSRARKRAFEIIKEK